MKKSLSKLIKPKKKDLGKAFVWREVRDFIQKKYKVDLDDYKGKFKKNAKPDTKYCNFWHWMVEDSDIHNGCFTWLGWDWLDSDETEPWIKEILTMIMKEFAPKDDDLKLWVDW